MSDIQHARRMKLEHTASMARLALLGPLTPDRRAEALRVISQCESELAQLTVAA